MLSASLAQTIIGLTAQAVMVTDRANKIVYINAAFTRITGYSEQEAVGQAPSLLSSGRQSKSFYDDMWFALTSRGFWQGEIWNRRKDGSIYPEWVTINVIRADGGEVTHHVALFSDITLQQDKLAKVQHLAHYDALTGLGNRLLLRDRLREALIRAQAREQRTAVLFIDLDGFKKVNDGFGHGTGDELLIGVGKRLNDTVRAEDTVFRQGGDEFVVIIPELAAKDTARFVAKRIATALSKPFAIAGHRIRVGASLGISTYPDDGADIEELLLVADKAMYQAKMKGRGRVCYDLRQSLFDVA